MAICCKQWGTLSIRAASTIKILKFYRDVIPSAEVPLTPDFFSLCTKSTSYLSSTLSSLSLYSIQPLPRTVLFQYPDVPSAHSLPSTLTPSPHGCSTSNPHSRDSHISTADGESHLDVRQWHRRHSIKPIPCRRQDNSDKSGFVLVLPRSYATVTEPRGVGRLTLNTTRLPDSAYCIPQYLNTLI